MSEQSIGRNPFMLMLNPEVVLAAMEKSEKLAQLNRHQCRPLDRVTMQNPNGAEGSEAAATGDAEADAAGDPAEADGSEH
jgi:hypothetical protein